MSNNNYSYSSSSYSYTSSSGGNGQSTSNHYAEQTKSDPRGTTYQSATQRNGEPLITERRDYDSSGRPVVAGNAIGSGSSGMPTSGRIEDVSDERQRANDRLYEERMEDEYAKREGGA